MVWPTGQLAPDFKTIADFRKDNGNAIREVCREFIALCRKLDLFSEASVAIDGSKFKAVNARDKNFTEAKMKRRFERIDGSIARYLSQLETADRHGDAVREKKRKGAGMRGQKKPLRCYPERSITSFAPQAKLVVP